jgi:hypothetical protein
MKQLKYIRRIFENTSPIDIISVNGKKVTLLNPDGKQVTIEVEEDGNYSEYIDSYTKEVSVSGDDGTYQYGMTASTDRHDNHFEIMTDYDIDVESIEEVTKRKEKQRISFNKRQSEYKIQQDNEASKRDELIAKSGLSRDAWLKEEQIKQLNNNNVYIELNKDTNPDSDIILIELIHMSYDEDSIKPEYIDSSLIKYPVPLNPLNPDDDDFYEMTSFFGLVDVDSIKSDLTNKKIIVKYRTEFGGIKQLSDVDDPHGYIKRIPFYANVEHFIN